MEPKEKQLSIPAGVISPVDVRRLLREVEGIDEFLLQARVREGGSSMQLPRTTKSLDELSKDLGLNLLEEKDRRGLQDQLKSIQKQAPVIHMSFASDPSPAFLQKLIEWFRKEIHPLTLLQIGLEPSIAVGCSLRTVNRYFDLSLRKHFQDKHGLLLERLKNGESGG